MVTSACYITWFLCIEVTHILIYSRRRFFSSNIPGVKIDGRYRDLLDMLKLVAESKRDVTNLIFDGMFSMKENNVYYIHNVQ